MSLGINYDTALAEARMRYSKYAQYSAQANQGATSNPVSNTGKPQVDTYESGIKNNGFFENKCTDGADDGKIGLFSAMGNAIEGVGKGLINGVAGALGFGKDENGKTTWNPLKALGTVAIGAACIAFPPVGAAACAIGAVAGGVQVAKGAKVALSAKTDAEAKAAWENIGEGGATVVGCALGAKASVGAMKGTSTAAIDDAMKGLDNVDDVAKALKGVDKTNIDDVTAALNKAGIDNVDDVTKVISSVGDNTSALSQVDDSLKGMDALKAKGKAFYKDAVSSSKNNGGKILKKANTAKEVAEYKHIEKKYNKIDKGAALTDDELAIMKELDARKAFMSDDAQKVVSKIDDISDSAKAIKDAKNNLGKEQKAYKEALKNAKKAGQDTSTVSDSSLKAAKDALKTAKENTTYGKFKNGLKNTETGKYLKQALSQDEKTSVLKNIKNIKLKDVGGALSKDGQAILSFLQSGEGTYAQAVKQFGYDNVMQVLQVVYGLGQAEQHV